MENLNTYLNNIREELKIKMENAKYKKVRSILNNLISKSGLTKEQISDIIAETCFLNDHSFMLEVYPKVRKKIANKFSSQGEVEIEYYIVNKYCLYDKEKIIEHFFCDIKREKNEWFNFNGAVILTNLRLIIYGKPMRYEFGMPNWDIEVTNGACNKSLENIFQSIGQLFVAKPCYGYQFPILGAYKLSSNKKDLTFSMKMVYEKQKRKKPKLKSEIERITIKPVRAKRGEANVEFKEWRSKIINSLVHTILYASKFKVF
ncbi:MAG: hypothetical protein ACFFAN_07485 [Promethearchaeota archaeon]